jgi:hypothetical protein
MTYTVRAFTFAGTTLLRRRHCTQAEAGELYEMWTRLYPGLCTVIEHES